MTTISVEVSVVFKTPEPEGVVLSRVVTVVIVSSGVRVATGVDMKIIPARERARAAGLGSQARAAAGRALRHVQGREGELAEAMCRELFGSAPPVAGEVSE